MNDTERYDHKRSDVSVIRHHDQYAVWKGDQIIEWTQHQSTAVKAFVAAVKERA